MTLVTGDSRDWTKAGLEPPVIEALSRGLTGSELWSLLLDVMTARAAQRTPRDIVGQHEHDGFTRPSVVDQRTLLELDAHLFAAAAPFEAIELSPVTPLGACSAVGLSRQNRVLSALRGTEVVADPTNVLALECAARLRRDPSSVVRLATSHRCVRAQPVPKGSGFAQHFRMFALATAGREREHHEALVSAVVEQITTHWRTLERLARHGYAFPCPRVTVLASDARAVVADRVMARINGVPVSRALLDHPYYDGLRFRIDTGDPNDAGIPLVDGGAFDWVATLTSNRRMVYVASGLGSQLVAALFRG